MTPRNYSWSAMAIRLWLLSIAPFTSVFGQNQRVIDSLLTVLPQRTGAEKYTVYHWLTVEYADWDNQKALGFANSAENVAYAVGDSFLIVKSQRLKGEILVRLGRPQDVILILDPFVNDWNLRKYTTEELIILNLMGG